MFFFLLLSCYLLVFFSSLSAYLTHRSSIHLFLEVVIPISSLKLAGIKHPPPHPSSSHSFSIPLSRLHGVSWVHAILHSFTYPLKPFTQAPISIQLIPILHATHNHVLPYPCVHPFNHTTKPVSLSRSSYPFPHSSLQESSILHHTHFPLIHSPPHSLTYMESRGCMLSFTPSHTH